MRQWNEQEIAYNLTHGKTARGEDRQTEKNADRDKTVTKMVYILVRDGWKSINKVQKVCLVGIAVGIVMLIYAFNYAFYSKYGVYIAISGYVLAICCSVGYALFQYFPVSKNGKQKTINDYY